MKSGFKRFLPAFVLGMMGSNHHASIELGNEQQKRIGKSKGGGKRRGFFAKTLRPLQTGTSLGNVIKQYRDSGGCIKYAKPDLDGCRALMEKNWHREFMGKA